MNVTTPNGFNLDNSGRRIVVDPVTRIEGHMRCEVNVDENGVIRNAVSTGTMWRGLEVILKGRDPRDAWAFTERICGVCTGTHALTSVRAVEDALGIEIPDNANSIRNMMQLNLQIHDHIVHFYHLHALDWVNPINALNADPRATSALQQAVSPSHPMSSPGYFRDIQNRIRRFAETGSLGLFRNGYWDNPAYKLPPEADLMAVTHYLEALDLQKEVVKVHTIFGGKNPHPNWLVGGVPCPINVHGRGATGAINMERLNMVDSIIAQCSEFVRNVYIPDVIAIGGFYRDWLYGGGLSSKNVLAYGDIPEHPNNFEADQLHLPRGAIINGDLSTVHDVDVRDPEQVQEFVAHSWYDYGDHQGGLHPWDGVTEPRFELGRDTVGSRTNIENIDEGGKYSWIKAPRWRGHAMEVGPLSRYIIGYAKGHERITDQVTGLLRTMDLPVEALFSTLGRTAARALEAEYCADLQRYFFTKLIDNIRNGDQTTA
ncbi:MAG: nickel-dependent hydrogenase large subunit, partial [Rubricella sp.]